MYDSKHWPFRPWRRVYLAMLSVGAAALFIAGFTSPDAWIWW